jgi:membrane protein
MNILINKNKFSDIDNYKNDILYNSLLRVLFIWAAYILVLAFIISMLASFTILARNELEIKQKANEIINITYNIISFIPSFFKLDPSTLTMLVTISLTVFVGMGIADSKYSDLDMYDEAVSLARRLFALGVANGAGIIMFSNYMYGLFIFFSGRNNSEIDKNILYNPSYIWTFLFLSAFVIVVGKIASDYPKDRQKHTNKILRRLIYREKSGGYLSEFCIKDTKKLREEFLERRLVLFFPQGSSRAILWYFVLSTSGQLFLLGIFFNWVWEGGLFYGDNIRILPRVFILILFNSLFYIYLVVYYLPLFLRRNISRKKFKNAFKFMVHITVIFIIGLFNIYCNLLSVLVCIRSGYLMQGWVYNSGPAWFIISLVVACTVTMLSSFLYRKSILSFYCDIFMGEKCDKPKKSMNLDTVYHLMFIWNLWSKARNAYRKELFVNNEKYSDIKMVNRYWYIHDNLNGLDKYDYDEGGEIIIIPYNQGDREK